MLRKVRKMVTFERTKEIVIERRWLVIVFFLKLSINMGVCFVIVH